MKNMFLAATIVSVLTIASIGGTIAGFSDTEISQGNFFEVGSLDLQVSDRNGVEYDDPNVPTLFNAALMMPCISKDFVFDMHSRSEPEGELAWAYIKFKEFECMESPTTKHPDGRPEPEVVAENGGELANQTLAGAGAHGQTCDLDEFVEMALWFDMNGDGDVDDPEDHILGNQLWQEPGLIYLSEVGDKYISLGQIPACQIRKGKLSLHISNWSEAEWNAKYETTFDYFDDSLPFDHWPTNLFMLDKITFNAEFALTQDPIPDAFLWTP